MGDFSFWYFWDMNLKKRLINLRLKKGKISGMAQIGIFSDFNFFGFLSIASFIAMQFSNAGGVLKNSGNLQQNGHKNFEN